MYEAVSVSGTSVVDAGLTGFVEQKVKYWPSEEFLFVVEVFWSNKTTTFVKRTYREFEAFRHLLKQYFLSKYQSGEIKTPVAVPFLQGRKLFQKNTREIAEERETELHTFLKQLIPGTILISSNKIVVDFFKSRPSDPTPSRVPGDTGYVDDDNNNDDDEDVLFDR